MLGRIQARSACTLACLAVAATVSVAQPAPLTKADEDSLLQALNLPREQLSRIVGVRGGLDGTSATADLYGEVIETSAGNCVAVHFWIDGTIVDDEVQWDVRTDAELRSRLNEVVWLERHRLRRPCSSLFDHDFLTLGTPIEEQTLANLDRSAEALAMEAASRAELGLPYGADQIKNGRLRAVEVDNIRASGTYRLELKINQCNGIAMRVKTNGEGKFLLVDAGQIIC